MSVAFVQHEDGTAIEEWYNPDYNDEYQVVTSESEEENSQSENGEDAVSTSSVNSQSDSEGLTETLDTHNNIFPGESEAGLDGIFFEVRTRRGDKTVYVGCKRCPDCNRVIELGQSHTGKKPTLHTYNEHVKGAACALKTKKQRKVAKDAANQPSVADIFGRLPKKSSSSGFGSGSSSGRSSKEETQAQSSPGSLIVVDLDDEPDSDIHDPIGYQSKWKAVDSGFSNCCGIILQIPGNIFTSYPWHLHHFENMSYIFSGIEESGTKFRIRSKKCTDFPEAGKESCNMCLHMDTGAELRRIRERVEASLPATMNFRFYNFTQLCELLAKKNLQLNELKLKTLNLSRQVQTLTTKIDDHKRMVVAIATSDLPSVSRLVNPQEIMYRIKAAKESVYHVKGFTPRHFDMSKLVLILGGPRLLTAVAKEFDLPAKSSVYAKMPSPYIAPSIQFPLSSEINANLQTLHNAHVLWPNDSPPRHGMGIMVDNIAIEERPRYDGRQGAILGFCREHSTNFDLRVVTVENMEDLASHLKCGVFHRATEATVASLAAYGAENYSPATFLISGTCKAETADMQVQLWETIIDSWYSTPHDGDATFRRSLHAVCMKKILQRTSPLWSFLGPLVYMNLGCGNHEILADKDMKYKLKNYASHLRTASGFFIGHTQITPPMLRHAFRKYLDMDEAALNILFDPKDHQNVPKAIRLLSAVRDLNENEDFTRIEVNYPITFLGKILGYFIDPFVKTSWSLSQQLTSLSALAHTLFHCWRMDGSKFCAGSLYYHIQSLIKNIYWDVAKQKVLDVTQSLYINQRGSDRLEQEFGNWRTMDHNRNMDLAQLGEHAGIGAELSRIYGEHKEWFCGHRRLNLQEAQGIDHTNPQSFTGDLVVGNASLITSWRKGRITAEGIMKQFNIPGAQVAFDITTMEDGSTIDMLRPCGVYVGLRQDDTLTDFTEIEAVAPIRALSKWLHKASAVRIIFNNPWDDGRKTTERLTRVKGYSRDGPRRSINSDSIFGDDFMIGQLVATFIRVNNKASLAILKVTKLVQDGMESLESIHPSKLSDRRLAIHGQVLNLNHSASGMWTWTGRWESLNLPIKGKEKTKASAKSKKISPKSLLVETRGNLVMAVNPCLTEEAPITWIFSLTELESLSEVLWSMVEGNIGDIPMRSSTTTFPYAAADKSISLIHAQGSAILETALKEGEVSCYFCRVIVDEKMLRHHIEKHILSARFGFPENVQTPVTAKYPCGYCGREGCHIGLKKTQKTHVPESFGQKKCDHFVKFSLSPATTSSLKNPSTNRPIICELCQDREFSNRYAYVFWTYNMPQHLDEAHAGETVPAEFAAKFTVTIEELQHLKLVKENHKGGGTKRGREEELTKGRKKAKK
ncbi:hypothetical protein M422DRAFT_53688 [Sphaerobolus stellatus SS14]|uniref:Uncharacterized protein n=1 Tax=Sphaerobolus stellatus (strain SS14) TaxID=990650 RepID=A0A0C9UZM6_SPHS4|nr:hypothetical protein M422DRAFT_53688 [Sphaerobolus stellatus SS14]